MRPETDPASLLIIEARNALEKIVVSGNVPEHPDVKDIKPGSWSSKAIRPDKIQGTFVRENGETWRLSSLRVYGFDVLKSGKPSDNINCYRDASVPTNRNPFGKHDKSLAADAAWALDWADVELARINDITERADLNSDVVLGRPVDLDEPQPRRFPLDSPEPRENGLDLRHEVTGIVFRYKEEVGRWLATTATGGDGNEYSWHALNSSYSEYATGALIEEPR